MSKKKKIIVETSSTIPIADQPPFNHDEATAYAGETMLVQERLRECMALVDSGKPGEAVMSASRSPTLLSICESASKEDFERWVQVCESKQWPVPTYIDPEEIKRLEILLAQQLDEATLTKTLRKAVRAKDHLVAMQTLRQLRVLRPDKPELRQDLAEFERTRLDHLKNETPQVLAGGDETAILHLASEVEGEWVITIPPELKGPLLAKAEEIRLSKKVAELSALIDKVSMAYAAGDLKKAAPLVGNVEGLLRAQSLSLPHELQQEWEDDLEWFQNEKAQADKQSQFNAVVRQLEEAVKEADVEAMDRALREVRVFELPFSEELARQAELKIQNTDTEKSRAKQRNTVLLLVMLALLAGGGLFYAYSLRKNSRVVAVLTQLENMSSAEAEDLEGLLALKQRLETQEPDIFTNPGVQDMFSSTIPNVVKVRTKRQQELERVLTNVKIEAGKSEMMTYPAGVFTSIQERVEALLSQAEGELARNADETVALSKAAQAWRDALRNREEHRRSLWRAKFAETSVTFEALSTLEAEPQVLVKKQKEFEQLLTRLPERPDASAEAEFKQLQNKVERWSSLEEGLNDQLTRIATAENLSDYLKEVETFVLAYPEHEQVPALQEIIEKRELYEAFTASIVSADAGNPFWAGASSRVKSRQLDQNLWEEVRDEIVSWDVEKVLVDVFYGQVYEDGANRMFFMLGPLPSTLGIADNEMLEVDFYLPAGSNEKSPVFASREISSRLIKNAKQLPICTQVSELFAKLRYTEAHEGYETLLAETQLLLADGNLNGIFQLDMGKSLLEQVIKLAPEQEKFGLQLVLDRMQGVDNSIHWLCSSHPQYDGARNATKKIVSSSALALASYVPSESKKILDLIVMDRQPVFIGHHSVNEEEFLSIDDGVDSSEFWVVRLVDDQPRFYIQSLKTSGGLVQNMPLLPGEPVFTPKDGRSTRDVLTRARRGQSISASALRKMPDWPINIPEL